MQFANSLIRLFPMRVFGAILLILWGADSYALHLPRTVLVVQNNFYPESVWIADYYMAQRQIPLKNRCSINVSKNTELSMSEYESEVRIPIQKCLNSVGKNNIYYIVFTYLTPFRVSDPSIPEGIRALDSVVADIFDEVSPSSIVAVRNPYYEEASTKQGIYPPFESLADFRQKGGPHIYSVWRIDAPSEELAEGLITHALRAERCGISGNGYFDRRFGEISLLPDSGYYTGDWDLYMAARFAKQAGFKVTEDDNSAEFGTSPAPLRCPKALFYSGWFSNHYNDVFTWNPGAIGFHLDSSSALDPRKTNNWAGGALARGITVTSGAVGEPYLNELPHPDTAFKYLFEGHNVGDSFFRSTHAVKWMVQNIGDPLYRPLAKGHVDRERDQPECL